MAARQVAPATGVAGPCADVVTPHPPLLIRNSIHPAVREAQRKLNIDATGTPGGPLVPDCVLGPKTEAALKAFQAKAFPGDPKQWDGKIGPKTWGQLDAVKPKPTPPPTPPAPPPVAPTCKVPTNPDRSGKADNPTTSTENSVAARHIIDALTARSLATDALAAASSSGLAGLHLGPADAFRHALWNCQMTQELGAVRAEQFATGHENSGPSSIPFDNQMDLHNNATGRSLAAMGDCAVTVRAFLAAGQLRTVRGPHTHPSASPPITADCLGASDEPWP